MIGLARLAGVNLVRGILFCLTSRTRKSVDRHGSALFWCAWLYSGMIACYTQKMSKRTKTFLMQYVRRALLLLAEGIKYWCDDKVADPESATD